MRVLRSKINDERFSAFIGWILKAGHMEDWKFTKPSVERHKLELLVQSSPTYTSMNWICSWISSVNEPTKGRGESAIQNIGK